MGVIVTSAFNTFPYCQQAVNPARRTVVQLRRGFAVLTPQIFRPRYLALVSEVWPVDVIALPTTRYRPDGAHRASGCSFGQRYEKVGI